MKAFFVTLLAVCCAAVLILGNLHWVKKTTVAEQVEISEFDTNITEEKETTPVSTNPVELLAYAKNWPKKSREHFQLALEEKRPFHILIIGSEAMNAQNNGWPQIVQEAVKATYHDSVMIETLEYNMTSAKFILENKQQDLIDHKADMIIIEPFTYKDNGKVRIENSLANLTTIMNDVKGENPTFEFVVQPPHPIYNAKYYPIQVAELKEYSEKHGLTYLDHWTEWPDWHTEEIKEYLLEDGSGPSVKGHGVWGEYLKKFLVEK